mgnify:CR=1 FL=1
MPSVMDSRLEYISLISQFPMYASIKFFAHYKGLWHYGIEFILAVNHLDIKLISIQEKTIACQHKYAEIESFSVDFEKSFLTIMLRSRSQSKQKCYLFEVLDIEDLAALLESYAPELTVWTDWPEEQKNRHKVSNKPFIT